MDNVEMAVLASLATKSQWTVDELPSEANEDILRGLDLDEMIEARFVFMKNNQQEQGGPTTTSPWPQEWYSPLRQAHRWGDWGSVLQARMRDRWKHPSEIRITERAKATLARFRRAGPQVDGADPIKSRETASDCAGLISKDANPQNRATGGTPPVREDAFLSEREPADAFNVSQDALRPRLRAWRPHHMNNEWIRIPNPRPRDPRYIYLVRAVRPLISELQATGQPPANKKDGK